MTLVFLCYHMLSTMTESEFTFVATFIGLPFVTIIPKLVQEIAKNFIDFIDSDD